MELLIKKARKGDKESFIKLIDGYMIQMYKVAKTRLKNEEDIGDAIQETILSAFTGIKDLRNTKYFNTWIIKILINECKDIIAKNKIVYIESYDEIKNQELKLYISDDIDSKIDFDNMLEILSQEYRTVVVMYYVNRLTTKEIGNILNEKEGTIKSRLSRAKQKLKMYYVNTNTENSKLEGRINEI